MGGGGDGEGVMRFCSSIFVITYECALVITLRNVHVYNN